MRTKLSVNINKVALIRNSRNSNKPDIIKFAMDCEAMGADGITVHPRPDQRHAKYSDLSLLKDNLSTELNVEGYPSDRFLQEVLRVVPHQCTLVPDPPGILTSDSGWDVRPNHTFLVDVLGKLKEKGIRTSLFLNPELDQVKAAKEVGTDRIELYTGEYANKYDQSDKELKKHVSCARLASEIGLGINAGHDLNLDNLRKYKESLIKLDEVSIGHALICDAIYFGIANSINMYKNLLS